MFGPRCLSAEVKQKYHFKQILDILGAWGSVVVKALRYYSEGLGIDPELCRWGFFPKLPSEPCALGSTQPLKMSTRKTPAESREDPGALTFWNPRSHLRLVAGNLYLYLTF